MVLDLIHHGKSSQYPKVGSRKGARIPMLGHISRANLGGRRFRTRSIDGRSFMTVYLLLSEKGLFKVKPQALVRLAPSE
jgi:hypothetical protein